MCLPIEDLELVFIDALKGDMSRNADLNMAKFLFLWIIAHSWRFYGV